MEKLITLRGARVSAGLTQRQVCEALNISRPTLCNYEKGRTIPDMRTGEAMAKLYKMPIDVIKFF